MSNLTAYTNYWHFPLVLGSSLAQSQKSTEKQGFVAKNKLQIIALAAFILSTTTLLIGVFNTIMYQSILPNPTTTSAVVVDVSTDVVAITNTTTTTTTVNTTTTTAAHSAANTDAATSTTSSTSVDIVTTTTTPAPSCPSMLRHDNGVAIAPSKMKFVEVNLTSFHMWGKNMESGTIVVEVSGGSISLGYALLYVLTGNYATDWTLYYRNDSLPEEKEAVGCLVSGSVSDVYIFTWKKNDETTTIQCIFAFNNQSATHIIRIYSGLESFSESGSVEFSYQLGDDTMAYFDSELKPRDVTEQRLITDVTNAHNEGDQITFFDKSNNCGIFKC